MPADLDVVVLGGGLTGLATLLECSRRGWSCMLIEAEDLASGGSGGAGEVVDPSFRRLADPPEVAREIAEETARLRRIAAPLVRPFPLATPADDPAASRGLAGFSSGTDPLVPSAGLPPPRRIGRSDLRDLLPGISPEVDAAILREAFHVDTGRLAVEIALAAEENGAAVRNHCRAESLLLDRSGEIAGVRAQDPRTGEREEIGCRAVVNAGGAWAGEWEASPPGLLIRETRILLKGDGDRAGLTTTSVDGRGIGVHPAGRLSVIGSVLRYHFGTPEEATAGGDEAEVLLRGLDRILPGTGSRPVLRAEVRVHRSADRWGVAPGKGARGVEALDHEDAGRPGLLSVHAGIAVLARQAARRVGDLLARRLAGGEPAPEGDDDLLPCARGAPGGDGGAATLPGEDRLRERYGGRIGEIRSLVSDEPSLAAAVCPTDGQTAAEVLHAIRGEWAVTLEDLRRRTGLGTGPCAGIDCSVAAALLLAREDVIPFRDVRREVERFARRRRAERGAALAHGSVALEEMARAVYAGALGLEY